MYRFNWEIREVFAKGLPPYSIGYYTTVSHFEVICYCFSFEKAELIFKALVEGCFDPQQI